MNGDIKISPGDRPFVHITEMHKIIDTNIKKTRQYIILV